MNGKKSLPDDVIAKFTGAARPGTFERACYVVRVHGDGTGTIALDWYEMSDGRDYMTSEVFMRTEVAIAKRIASL
jgi:hypothetical protein